MLHRMIVKKMKDKNPKTILVLRQLLCPLDKNYPMRDGLANMSFVRFMNAVDTASGKRLANLNDNIDAYGKVNLAPLAPWCWAKQTVDKEEEEDPLEGATALELAKLLI